MDNRSGLNQAIPVIAKGQIMKPEHEIEQKK
jgi:hypothetical protein